MNGISRPSLIYTILMKLMENTKKKKVRLTVQNYFIQRICNEEKRFARSPAYMYAAVAYIEKKQLQRNINLAYTRGKETIDENEKRHMCWKMATGYWIILRILRDTGKRQSMKCEQS